MRHTRCSACLAILFFLLAASGRLSAAGSAKPAATPAKPDATPTAKPDAAKKDASKKDEAKNDTGDKSKEAAKPAVTKSGHHVHKATAKKTEEKKTNVVRLTLRGELPEHRSGGGLFSEMQVSLSTVLERLQQAAEDKDVAAVLLRIEDLNVGAGKTNELRGAIARFHASGKPVYAELASGSVPEYVVAMACDQVCMPPSGVLMVPGVRAEMMFFKGLFDKLGIQFDILQQGKYKGAGEPFTRTKMSPALHESFEAIVDDSYEALAKMVAKDRKLPDYQVKTLIDQGLFTAAQAKKAGLVDELLYADQLEELLRKKLKAPKLNVISNYKKKQVDTDFSGFGGMMKLMELMMGGGKQGDHGGTEKRVAVIYAVGPILEGKPEASPFGEEVITSGSIISALRTAADDAKVVAVVLRIDSPGGSAVASDLIWREIVRLRKPVIASMSDVAGSGGYYIAMGAAKIVAAPGTITGSIGVIGGKLVLRGLMDKVGLSTEVISRGKNVGALTSTDAFSPSEREAWLSVMEEIYHQFVNKAAQGRKMPYPKLEALAQGRIYTGRMAVANGLVDRLGTLQDAIDEAKKAAHIPAGEKVDLLVLPKPRSFFEQLLGDSSVSTDLDMLLPGAGATLRQVALWQKIFAERSLLLMPYTLRVR